MTSKLFKDVVEFQETILKDFAPPQPTLVSQEYVESRIGFLLEEISEFMDAIRAGDIVAVADGLADIIYVALGTAYRMGLPFEEIWNAVHAANMRKDLGETKRGMEVDAMKPEGWVGPEAEIARAIARRLET